MDDHKNHDHEKNPHADDGSHNHGGPFGERSELIFAILSVIALAIGWVVESLWSKEAAIVSYLAAYVFGGFFAVREAVENLRLGKFQIDTLMIAAAIGAAILGHWSEGALLLALFSIGHALEGYAMGRAKRAIEALGKLAPKFALVKRQSGVEQVAIEALVVGDIVVVKPNERLPADGLVIVGETSVDQSPVTGESVPVEKRPYKGDASGADAFAKASAEAKVPAPSRSMYRVWLRNPRWRVWSNSLQKPRPSALRRNSSPTSSNVSLCHVC